MSDCPGGLELCGVPCGCDGRNASHYPKLLRVAETFDAKYRRCEVHNRARYWCGCYYADAPLPGPGHGDPGTDTKGPRG